MYGEGPPSKFRLAINCFSYASDRIKYYESRRAHTKAGLAGDEELRRLERPRRLLPGNQLTIPSESARNRSRCMRCGCSLATWTISSSKCELALITYDAIEIAARGIGLYGLNEQRMLNAQGVRRRAWSLRIRAFGKGVTSDPRMPTPTSR